MSLNQHTNKFTNFTFSVVVRMGDKVDSEDPAAGKAASQQATSQQATSQEVPQDHGPIWLRLLRGMFLVATVLLLGVLYWVLFFMGTFGYGATLYKKLEGYESFFYSCALTSVALLVTLATFDVTYWKGCFYYVGQFMIAVTVTGFLLTGLTFTSRFPAASICVYLVVCPMFLFILKRIVLRGMTNLNFLGWLSASLLLVGGIAAIAWLVWLNYPPTGNWWNDATREEFYKELGCFVECAITPACNRSDVSPLTLDAIDDAGLCDEAFLMWISPLILAIFSLVLSASLFFIVRAQKNKYHDKSGLDNTTQLFVVFLALILLGMWTSAGIAGAQIGLATLVFTFSFLFLVVGGTALVLVIGVENIRHEMARSPLAQRLIESSQSDWLRALVLLALAPCMIIIFPLSFIRQLGRKYVPFTKTVGEQEAQLVFSLELTKAISRARKWHWTSVLTKMIWWGVAFFCLSVIVARALNVFFSWLNSVFIDAGYGLGGVCGIFALCGALAFQFPPTPGLPVYYASAVIIGSAALSAGWNFWAGWALATAIAFALKYSLVISGQFIGEVWGKNSVQVRKAVNVNSVELKAMRHILSQKGLSKAKVGILVGGPGKRSLARWRWQFD